jgi:2-furoate---CoA ligase
MNVGHLFERAVTRFPDRVAVVDGDAGTRYTYEEWGRRVRTLASALESFGVEPGDRVGAVMRNRVELATLHWATQVAGAVFVPYNFRAAADDLAFLVDNADPDVLFFSGFVAETVETARAEFDGVDTFVSVDDDAPGDALGYADCLARGDPDAFEPTLVDPDATNLVLHTSGTTGRPKGVPRTHLNAYASSTAQAIQHRWADGVTTLGLMPIYHTMGYHTMTTALLLNGTLVTQRSFDPAATARLIEDERITSLYLVPTVFHDLVESTAIERADVSHVDRLSYAGIPMTTPVQEQVRETFDPDSFVNHYGSTELYTYSVCHWLDEKPGCAGRADLNTEVRVVRPEQGETVPPSETLPPGDRGEVIVDASSPEAFDGYLDRPAADAESFNEGWYFTGDLGYLDEDGDLFVAGRVDDMIISGGENVYPVEVEDVLEAHDAVVEVAVVGHQDDRWNQIVTAYVRPAADPADGDFAAVAADLDEYCLDRDDLADYKRPRRYVFVDDITKSNVGKVLRRELQEHAVDATVYADVDVSTL